MAVERYVASSSGKYSSSSEWRPSELRREPGIDLAGGFCEGYRPLTAPEGGEASCKLDCEKRLFRPGGELTLFMEKRFGRENEVGKPASA